MPEDCPVDFWTHYSYLCLKSKVCPLKSVLKNLKGKELYFPVENIRREHWPFLLSALNVDQSLTKVWFWSNFPIAEYKEMSEKKKKNSKLLFPIPYGCTAKNITDICKCVSQLLHTSKALKILMIENLVLRNEDIQNLAEGLKDSNIEKFSLAGCQLQDESVEILCRGLQLSTVSWIDFSMCGLNEKGLTFICDFIKAHHLKRSNDMFPETLRYRLPILDDMKGLRRISLNNNDIEDRGVEILMECLQEDIWMKALDLQKCSIGNEGAISILKILRSNVGLQLIDLRQNNIEATLIDRIALQLSLNNAQKDIKFHLGDLWKPPNFENAVRRRIGKTRNVKHIVTSKPGSYTSMEKKLKVSMGLLKKIEKIHVGDTEKKHTQTKDAYSQTIHNFNQELDEVKNALLHEIKVQNSLKQLVKKYKLESSLLRKELDKMAVLENYILIDHETFVEVTNIFEKFKKFLEAMKKYGLWECIEMLGVSEKSDIALKPFIIDTTRKCMQLVESDSPSNKKSDSVSSSRDTPKKHIPTEQSQSYNHQHNDKPRNVNEFREKADKISRQIQEQIYAKERPQTQSKVMKVFMDVRDNYSKSIISNQISDDRKSSHGHHHEDYYKQPKILQQMHHSKLNRSNSDNLVNKEQIPRNKKSVGSQTPSDEVTSHKQKSSSHEMARRKISTQKKIQSSTSVSDISSDEPSPVYERSIHESLVSSEYKSLPTPKSASKKESSRKLESSKSFRQSQASGDHLLNRSLHSERVPSSDSESTLRSSKIYSEKLPSDKSSHHGEPYSHPSIKSKTIEHVMSLKTSENLKSSSSVSSISSYNSRKEVKSDISGDKGDSNKSYLESVSDASTDKDVKSLSLNEVYSSVKDKIDLDHSNESKHSSKPKNSTLENSPVKDKTDSLNSKEKEVPPEKVPTFDEKLSKVSKDPIHSSSPKSSSIKHSQSKHEPPNVEKPLKRNNSDSSIPSLSDITTVSSRSLNTDSVMGQLSDN
ncbi:Centrosomal protein of 78 kDa like protein [Argiope bruennichi]|uniref:Centrosomal protein of 78 kDa like protein n=1 Tax=Argiope bruennichi TaxID=94029 RepID=A0A8T0EJP2_ARGBR|nr:Centrosomal protein of 78 kDa like protein [Argiope bruennichi]